MPFQLHNFSIDKPQKAFLFIMKEFGLNQREAQRLISKGRVFVDAKPMTNSSAMLQGSFEVVSFVPTTQGLKPLFTHKSFAAFDKPSGLLVHPSSKSTPYCLLDEVIYHLGQGANITHRIDQETSGLVLASATKEAEIAIKTRFEERNISKSYLALVKGKIEKSLSIDAPISRLLDPEAIVKLMMIIDPLGKPSLTHIEPKKYFEDLDMTLVIARPKTGRQHQIRVHLFHIGHPIIGDPIYNVPPTIASDFLDKTLSPTSRLEISGASRLLLHAQSLDFELFGEHYHIESEIDFEKVCRESLYYSHLK